MTLTCQAAEELLQAHLDGELTPGEAGGVDAHLVGCAPCRGVREELAADGAHTVRLAGPAIPAAIGRRAARSFKRCATASRPSSCRW